MTRLGPTLALVACAGLGYLSGKVVKNTATSGQSSRQLSRQSGETPAVIPTVSVDPAIETPLVAKLIPKVEPVRNPYKLVDGQLSPRGEWKWSQFQRAWVPVKVAGPRWVENGHAATISHLVSEHGYRRADLTKLTQSQLDTLHSNAHNRARRVPAPARTSYCPTGKCPRR